MWDIRKEMGMFSDTSGGRTLDSNLLHHFEGETPEGRVSALISTTSDLQIALEHAEMLMPSQGSESGSDGGGNEEVYVYCIRPDRNFYEVQGSLYSALNKAPEGSETYQQLSYYVKSYLKMDEWVAVNGFKSDRILNYATVKREMLENSITLDPILRGERWETADTHYDKSYEEDLSNSEPYDNV